MYLEAEILLQYLPYDTYKYSLELKQSPRSFDAIYQICKQHN
jgi:hypothetical protein